LDTTRHFIAVLLLVSGIPALLFWFVIHPFARFWRRVGHRWAYTVATSFMVLLGWILFRMREPLLGADYGTRWGLVALAAVFLALSLFIAAKRGKYLTARILLGLPELDPRQGGGKLLTEGIYGRMRHPRYAETLASFTAFALFANHLGTYAVLAAGLVLVYVLVLIEERELRERFGEAYVAYARRVPRFVPRRGQAISAESSAASASVAREIPSRSSSTS
jgi:protein-S-isoprenylcysteine O-methyltransferase Ste14